MAGSKHQTAQLTSFSDRIPQSLLNLSAFVYTSQPFQSNCTSQRSVHRGCPSQRLTDNSLTLPGLPIISVSPTVDIAAEVSQPLLIQSTTCVHRLSHHRANHDNKHYPPPPPPPHLPLLLLQLFLLLLLISLSSSSNTSSSISSSFSSYSSSSSSSRL